MKYLFINSVAGCGSTGRIAANQCRELQKEGHECVLAYGRRAYGCDDIKVLRIGTNVDNYVHALLTRLFDFHGFGPASYYATKKFLQWVDSYNPDVVWLHNLHGYYIHIGLLFEWMKVHQEKEYHWTLHDCWAFTGHCGYFTYIKCNQWEDKCVKCEHLDKYPKCYLFGNVEKNYEIKKRTFVGVKNFKIRTPSAWLAGLVKKSFLKDYDVEIVRNKVNRNIFFPHNSAKSILYQWGVQNQFILLAVANVWDDRKGYWDIIKILQLLDEKYTFIIVGVNNEQIKNLSFELKYMNSGKKQSKNSIIFSDGPHKNNCINDIVNEGKTKSINIALEQSKVIVPDYKRLYCAITGEEYNASLKEKIKKHASVVMIKHTDNVETLATLYSAADLFINPTLEDNYPTVNLEAIACGTPVITYDVGGAGETVDKYNWM